MRFDFGVHGVAIQIEYPDRLRDEHDNPRRAGWGTRVRQDDGDNWFHFPLPTPTVLRNDETVKLQYINFKLRLDGARIVDVHVREGHELRNHNIDTLPDPTVEDADVDFNLTPAWEFPGLNSNVNEPLALCLKLEFRRDGASAIFRGATAMYET